jgi:hypothetical protein
MKNVLLFLPLIVITFCITYSVKSSVGESNISLKEQAAADSIAKAFGELTVDVHPEKLYGLFNKFCLTHYGAETDPLVYEIFGEQLGEKTGSKWEYFFEKSEVKIQL